MRFKTYTSGIIHRVTPFIGLRGSLAGDRTAQLLHSLLLLIGVWTAAASISTLPLAPFKFHRVFDVLVLEVSLAAAFVVLRLGHFRRASMIYLASVWIWATLIFLFYGGVHSSGMVLYLSIPVSAAWLVGYRSALWAAAGCLLSALVFALWQTIEVSFPTVLGTPLGKWAVLVQATLISAIPVGQIVGRLRESQRHLVSIHNTVEDAIFHLAVEPEGQFRILSVNAAFLRLTGMKQEEVVGKTANEVIPEPSRSMVLKKYRQAIDEKTIVRWQETSDYPAGRLTGDVSVAPVWDKAGICTHLVGSVHDITGIKRAEQIENRLTSDLEHSRDEIRALATGLMKAQEDERRRISRELHDQICQQLASLAIEIGELAVSPRLPENTRAQVEAIRANLVKTSHETRHIAYQLHTAILDDLGLAASLKDLFHQFSERHPDIACNFEESGPPASVPSEVASCLYRVAQEGLHNIAKHSRAKGVSGGLDFRKGAILLTIQDDGAGFERKPVKGRNGLGLISMEERARSVNGKLTITSQPGQGTQISLEVPLPVDNS